MSSVILHKPAGVETSLDELKTKVVFESPKHIGVLYSDFTRMRLRKFSEKIGDMGLAAKFIKGLTAYPSLMFFSSEKAKKFIRNRENMPPVLVNDQLGYVGCGKVLGVPPEADKEFSDIFYFNNFSFRPITEIYPDFFFTFEGMWMLDAILPNESSIAFMKVDGEVTLSNQQKWESYNDIKFFDTVLASVTKKDKKKNNGGNNNGGGFQKTSKGLSKKY